MRGHVHFHPWMLFTPVVEMFATLEAGWGLGWGVGESCLLNSINELLYNMQFFKDFTRSKNYLYEIRNYLKHF